MGVFDPTVHDTPEDRGRLKALDAEEARFITCFLMVRKSRARRLSDEDPEYDPSGELVARRSKGAAPSLCRSVSLFV